MMHRRRMLAPIVSIKHYVNLENTKVLTGTRRSMEVLDVVPQNAVVNSEDVVEGSIVKAIYLELWLHSIADAGTDTKFQFVFEKVPSGATPITFTQMNNLMSYPNKKNVFFTSQGVMGDKTTSSVPVVRNWFKIPKGKQRMGAGDLLVMSLSATAFDIDTCGISTYKEYK